MRNVFISGQPPTFITAGLVDLFRDEIINYAQHLMAAGVPARLTVFPGTYYGEQAIVPDASASQRMTITYMTALKDTLSTK